MNQRKELKAAEDAAKILREQQGLSNPDEIPLDDVQPGRSGISLDEVMIQGEASAAVAESEPNFGGGKRNPKVEAAAREGVALMRRTRSSTSGELRRAAIRCPHCFEEIGKAAPFMYVAESGRTAICGVCGGSYP